MAEPTTPLEAYKALIDHFVNKTRLRGGASLIKKLGVYSNAPDHQRYNDFIRALTPEARALLVDMLQHEREGAIHDLLSDLSWWISCQEVALTFRGMAMPTDIEGGMHHDFVGRSMGYPWQNDF